MLPPAATAQAGPVSYGPTPASATPWMNLALYVASGAGPSSLALVCGQQFNRLPAQLAGCSHALLWPWDASAVKAQVGCGCASLLCTPCFLNGPACRQASAGTSFYTAACSCSHPRPLPSHILRASVLSFTSCICA